METGEGKPDFKNAINANSILDEYSIFTKFAVELRKTGVLNLDLINKKMSKIEHFFLRNLETQLIKRIFKENSIFMLLFFVLAVFLFLEFLISSLLETFIL